MQYYIVQNVKWDRIPETLIFKTYNEAQAHYTLVLKRSKDWIAYPKAYSKAEILNKTRDLYEARRVNACLLALS